MPNLQSNRVQFRRFLLSAAVFAWPVCSPAAAQVFDAGASGRPVTAAYNDLASHQVAFPVVVGGTPDSNLQCVQQMQNFTQGLDIAGASTELAGLLAETAAALDPSGITEAVSVLSQVAGFTARSISLGYQSAAVFSGTPECNTEFVGGLRVYQGGIWAADDSAINGSLGVGQTLSARSVVTNQLTTDQFTATRAISAFGGRILLGSVGGLPPQPGISIGGGAIAGAGHLGAESRSLDPTSVAIGNNSLATSEGSIAFGANARSEAMGATALGYRAIALGAGSTVLGADARSVGDGGVAIGLLSQSLGSRSVALGQEAQARSASSVAIGNLAVAQGGTAVSVGFANVATGNGAVAIGDPNIASGTGALAIGADNQATGNGALSMGNANTSSGTGAAALGQGSSASGNSSLAAGVGATAGGTSAIAVGQSAAATGTNALAAGGNARASGTSAVAVGAGSSAAFAGSAAFGPSAATTRNNQVVLGSAGATISMPGITSADSRAAQQGSLALVTTDAMGNLGTDGGALGSRIMLNSQGVALGIAMENPDLVDGEHGGFAFNWGRFNGVSAFSLSGAAVLKNELFGGGKPGRISISAAVAVASAENDPVIRRRQKASVATRVGGQITF